MARGLIGEVWKILPTKWPMANALLLPGGHAGFTMNYPLGDALLAFMLGEINAHALVRQLDSQRENLPAPFYYSMLNLLGSHDRPRAINVLAGEKDLSPIRALRRATKLSGEAYALGKKRYVAAFRFLCALPGMPCIYYGDEAGVQGMDDPFNRATFPWGREDVELTREIHEILSERHHSHALKTGMVKFFAVQRRCGVRAARNPRDGRVLAKNIRTSGCCACSTGQRRPFPSTCFASHMSFTACPAATSACRLKVCAMKQTVIVINGAGGAGKDTLCAIAARHYPTTSVSAVDRIKEIARFGGWTA